MQPNEPPGANLVTAFSGRKLWINTLFGGADKVAKEQIALFLHLLDRKMWFVRVTELQQLQLFTYFRQ